MRRAPIAARLDKDVDDVTILVDRTPQIVPTALDRHKEFVQIPGVAHPSSPHEVQHGPLLVDPFSEAHANFSADGRWFSYQTNETGAYEVYVQPYPVGAGAKRRITQEGGTAPVWSRSGRELFYQNDAQLWAVGIATEPTLTWQDPVALFEIPWPTEAGNFVNYDVTPDGQRFVFVQRLAGGSNERFRQVNVVLDWFEELKARVPVP